jgi:hypothetical protein
MRVIMSRPIKTFVDGSLLEFDQGEFDDWCVYLTRPGTQRHAPKDIEYFSDIHNYAKKYSSKMIYDDFVVIYAATGKQIENHVLRLIENLAKKFVENSLDIEIIFTILYAGMVAEENKRFTRLGKRVKRLGLFQTLFDGMLPSQAAIFSKGKSWRDIAIECQKRGF